MTLPSFLKPERIDLYSDLQPGEVAARLSAAIYTEKIISFGSLFDAGQVAGRVTATTLRLRKRIGYQNSFQSVFNGSILPAGRGSRIVGECAMNPIVTVFLCLWLGGVALFGGVIFVSMLFSPHPFANNNWIGLVIPPGMFLFGFLLFRFGRYLARDEARFLTDFIVTTLKGNDSSPKA